MSKKKKHKKKGKDKRVVMSTTERKVLNIQGEKRTAFAEFAEVLGVTTDSVVSAQSADDGATWTVLYTATPTAKPSEPLYRALLWRSPEGILVVVQNHELCSIGRFAAQVALIEQGDPVPIDEYVERLADELPDEF